jgi:hypothetical protein
MQGDTEAKTLALRSIPHYTTHYILRITHYALRIITQNPELTSYLIYYDP